jgi:hypothetical protein
MDEETAPASIDQYVIKEKYAEAAKEAVEACAAETRGQTCYFCLDDGESEGLVRMCACRGTAGFAHLSCLVRQAQVATGKNGEDTDSTDDSDWIHDLWRLCGMCEQEHLGVVKCALGWACYVTYFSLPKTCTTRRGAMTALGNSLIAAGRYEEALVAYQCAHFMARRLGEVGIKSNIAVCYQKLGRADDALRLQREVHADLDLENTDEYRALNVSNLAEYLIDAWQFAEAKTFMSEQTPAIRDSFGPDHCIVLDLQTYHGRDLFEADDATVDDCREAMTVLDDVVTRSRRVFGERHPDTVRASVLLDGARLAHQSERAQLAQRCAAHFTKIHSNPLQYCAKNCLLYEQGRMALITRDWQLLGDAKAKEADDAVGSKLRAAFSFRRDIIALKKILLRLLKEGRRLDPSLNSLGSYFFRDGQALVFEPGARERDPAWNAADDDYAELSVALQKLRGSLKALQDARDVTMGTCCLPRRREAPRPPRLRSLVADGCAAKMLQRASKAAPEIPPMVLEEDSDDDDRVRFGPARAVVAALDATALTPAETRYALAVVTCRGGLKALSIREQVDAYARSLRNAPGALARTADALDALVAATNARAHEIADTDGRYPLLARALRVRKEAVACRAAAVTLRGVRACCDAALANDGGPLFDAGDDGPVVLPERFWGVTRGVVRAREIAARYDALADGCVKDEGWPPPKESGRCRVARVHLDGAASCWQCGGETFLDAWCRDGVCWGCARQERAEGRCARGAACPLRKRRQDGFCRHANRCVVCDQHSCDKCALVRGDGDDVARIARQLGDDALVVVDFDRTLCSTRAGADPSVVGKKKPPVADEALCELLGATTRGFVLTRNSHRDGIRKFLDERHFDHVVVRSAKLEKTSKAAVLTELLDKHGVRAVYADDDVHELCDAGVAALARGGRVCRVLFAPGGVG